MPAAGKKAVEKDDLSLLGGMNAKERQKLHSKGIFNVTQLAEPLEGATGRSGSAVWVKKAFSRFGRFSNLRNSLVSRLRSSMRFNGA